MKKNANRILLWMSAFLAVLAFVTMYWLPQYQYRHREYLHHKHFIEFDSAIKPALRSDQRFENVFLGEFTGGGRGALGGFVASTNDLDMLRQIFANTLSNHPAAVGFQVKVVEANSR